MLKEIQWTELAESDLKQLLEYLSQHWNYQIAFKFIEKLDKTIVHIAKYPKLYPLIHQEFKVRKCVLTEQNSLFYKFDGQVIYILRIFDTRQNPDHLSLELD